MKLYYLSSDIPKKFSNWLPNQRTFDLVNFREAVMTDDSKIIYTTFDYFKDYKSNTFNDYEQLELGAVNNFNKRKPINDNILSTIKRRRMSPERQPEKTPTRPSTSVYRPVPSQPIILTQPPPSTGSSQMEVVEAYDVQDIEKDAIDWRGLREITENFDDSIRENMFKFLAIAEERHNGPYGTKFLFGSLFVTSFDVPGFERVLPLLAEFVFNKKLPATIIPNELSELVNVLVRQGQSALNTGDRIMGDVKYFDNERYIVRFENDNTAIVFHYPQFLSTIPRSTAVSSKAQEYFMSNLESVRFLDLGFVSTKEEFINALNN